MFKEGVKLVKLEQSQIIQVGEKRDTEKLVEKFYTKNHFPKLWKSWNNFWFEKKSWRKYIYIKFGFLFSMKIVVFLLIFYSFISTAALSGFLTLERISFIVLIPTLMQLLHFYYDSLIWRRKDGGELISKTLSKAL